MTNFTGFALAAAQLGFQSILIKPTRGLYGITLPDGSQLPDILAQATVEERHTDNLEITDHPIEQGASISDHAFKRPAEVVLQLGWSNSPSNSGSLIKAGLGALTAASPAALQVVNAVEAGLAISNNIQSLISGTDTGQIDAIYQQLLHLQESRALFSLFTAKRVYWDMICKSLVTETNSKTANALMVTMTCHQVILVNSKTVKLPAKNQKSPEVTSSVSNKGAVSPKAATLGK